MKKIFLIILITITLIPSISFSQEPTATKICNPAAGTEYCLLEPLPCIEGVGTNCVGGFTEKIEIKDYILYIYKFSIAVAVFLAIVMIIWGGFLYITSETPFKIADGKTKITNAVIGLAMVLASYLILLTIDPRLVNVDTKIPTINYKNLDLRSVRNFQNELSKKLNDLSAENQITAREKLEEVRDLEKQKEALENTMGKDTDEANIEKEELKLQKLEVGLEKAKIEAQFALAEGQALTNYSKFIEEYSKKDTMFLENKTDDSKNINLYKDSINKLYDEKINDIKSINANLGGEEIKKLEKQRIFFTRQLDEEKKIEELLYVTNERGDNFIPSTVRNELIKKNNEYKSMLSVDGANGAGLSLKAYSSILRTRIDTIEIFLEKADANK